MNQLIPRKRKVKIYKNQELSVKVKNALQIVPFLFFRWKIPVFIWLYAEPVGV